jgi:tetratricopeptide (TPR) repeat protein
MYYKKINELRKAGKLEEAMELVNQSLEAEPDNIWNKRAAAWVLYDYLKQFVKVETFDTFIEYLIKIGNLDLSEDQKMVFDQCAWKVGSMVFVLQKNEPVDYGKINQLFEIIRDFHFTKPSEAYSFLYKAFHKGYKNWTDYLDFADWWNFDNLLPEDYLKQEFKGKKTMSIGEQAYIAYSKKLLEVIDVKKGIDKDKIQSFLPKLDSLIKKHPGYEYPPFYKAKLLLAIGNEEDVLSAFLPFAKQKRKEFWVWELMGEIFPEDKDIQFACYCKALTLNTSEEFLVKLRQNFAEILIGMGMYNEAKTEIQKIIAEKEKQKSKIPTLIGKWMSAEWYKTAISNKDNSELYSSHAKIAEEILFRDIPEELIVVEFVNDNKNMLNFVRDKEKHGYFNYSGFLTKPKIGDLIHVRFSSSGQDGFHKILSAKKADSDLSSAAIKDFEGIIKITSPQNFGFIEDNYVEPKMIEKNKITHGQRVRGRSVLSFNKKKKEWGWKAIEVKTY